MIVKPLNSLQESRLFRILLALVVGITTDSKAVLNTSIEVHLIRVAQLLQDILGVMALVVGEDGIRLRCSNGQRAFEVLELVILNERWVGRVAGIDLSLIGSKMADNILAAEAVSYGSDFLVERCVSWGA